MNLRKNVLYMTMYFTWDMGQIEQTNRAVYIRILLRFIKVNIKVNIKANRDNLPRHSL